MAPFCGNFLQGIGGEVLYAVRESYLQGAVQAAHATPVKISQLICYRKEQQEISCALWWDLQCSQPFRPKKDVASPCVSLHQVFIALRL